MNTYYVTVAANMPYGCGYWEIRAPSVAEARRLAFAHCPDGRWSMFYEHFDDIHPMDRHRHGVIGAENENKPTSWREDLGTQDNIGTGVQ